MITNDISDYLSYVSYVYNAFVDELSRHFDDDTFKEITFPTGKKHPGLVLIVSKHVDRLELIRKKVVDLLAKYPDVKIGKISKEPLDKLKIEAII